MPQLNNALVASEGDRGLASQMLCLGLSQALPQQGNRKAGRLPPLTEGLAMTVLVGLLWVSEEVGRFRELRNHTGA